MDNKNFLEKTAFFSTLVLETLAEKKKLDPKAKVRNKPDPIFPSDSPLVKDDADHFPLGTENQARNALSRANQMKEAPEWFKGDLKKFLAIVVKKVHSEYPDIKISPASKKPGKG